MTTDTNTEVVFDIAAERTKLAEYENIVVNSNEALKVAASEMNMPEILRLSALISENSKLAEKQANKIRRSTGEAEITKKATISAEMQVLVANLLRSDEFTAKYAELVAVNPNLKGINIAFDGNAIEPGHINLIGGYRKTDPSKVGNTKRPRAAWNNDSFGTDEDGTPKTYTSREIVTLFGGISDNEYQGMDSNSRNKKLNELRESMGLNNLTVK